MLRKIPLQNILIFLLLIFSQGLKSAYSQENKKYILVVHGGAGTILKENMSIEKEAAYKATLRNALSTGYQALKNGKSSLDAVEAVIRVLEDSPLFNAGRGAVFTNDGRNELDASIMNGKTLEAGAVAGVTTIRNPISAARAVIEKSPHVLMVGRGAEQFAKEAGLEIVDPGYFRTSERWESFQKMLRQDSLNKQQNKKNKKSGLYSFEGKDWKYGTVGAVALDLEGNLAAGTSTGGMSNKKFGRVGDSPIIGAGTYANNRTVAVSGTGWGEHFIRNVVAYDVSALMEYKNLPVAAAAKTVLEKVAKSGGDGGLIALDKDGNMAMPFNTDGMFRGRVTNNGEIEVYLYQDSKSR